MAANTNKTGARKKVQTVDPIYQKFTRSVVRALDSSEFYAFFMDAVSKAENQIQFSNRQLEKHVDLKWVQAIEGSLQAFQTIIANPRRIIQEEELIVNVANAKRGGADVVQHLAQHASLVEKFDERTSEVRPSRVMQKYREDAFNQYENRLVYTALDMAYNFVKMRHDALLGALSDEFGVKLHVQSDLNMGMEAVKMDMHMQIKQTDDPLLTDEKNGDDFTRIARVYRILTMYMNTAFAKEMEKVPKVKGQIIKTNVLKKNPSYHRIVELLEFLRNYQDVGYSIRVVEQVPKVNETFQRDIFHNILFNYLILKGYMEDENDRKLPKPFKEKKRKLKPKFIKEIIEELTEDYNLPDVEIRKVLIEELTKEQLMHEEEKERLRLVEEAEQRRLEEAERLRQEQEAEEERLRVEKELAQERKRQEQAAAQMQRRNERLRQEQELQRRSELWKKDVSLFWEQLEEQKEARQKQEKKRAKIEALAQEAQLPEEVQQQRREAEKQKKQLQENEKRLQQQLEEQLRQEEEDKRQRALAEVAAAPYREEIELFLQQLPQQQFWRQQYLRQQRENERRREEEIRQRRALRKTLLNK